MAEERQRPRVLLVDDEENVLQALARQLRGRVAPELVTSPRAAAALLTETAADGDAFAVVMSDMRMPDMDGAALLKHARDVCPDTTRVLLTGYADLTSAIAAVNEGSVFRFLTKPCPTPQLHSTMMAAVEQHQLIRDRRELLEQTLRGAVEALMETLAMAQPAAFARASRLRRLAKEIASTLGLPDCWQVEVAAQLTEIGVITLPPEALAAYERGAPAGPAVAEMIAALPGLADTVLRRIPRLEAVRAIVRAQEPVDAPDHTRLSHADRPARLVQAVREFDTLTNRNHAPDVAVTLLRQRGHHDADILDALQGIVSESASETVREVDLHELHPGLVLAADLRSSKGALLVSRGHMLTEEVLARVRNFAALTGLEGRPIIMRGTSADPPVQ